MADQLIFKTKNFKVEYLRNYREFQLNMLQDVNLFSSCFIILDQSFEMGGGGSDHVGKCCVLPQDIKAIQSQLESLISQ